MKRILYLTRGGSIGGSQRQLLYVITNLNHGYEPIVVCHKDGQFFSQLKKNNIVTNTFSLHPWRKFPAGLYRYLDVERLCRFAKQHRVSLVHSSDLWLSNYMNWVAKRLKIPSILHVRTPITPKNVHKHNCDKATAIIAISRRVKRDLLCSGIHEGKINQIDDAVDLSIFKPKENKENVLRRDFSPNGRVLIGIVGRIQPSKRQLVLLETAEHIINNCKRSITLFIIGEVRYKQYFKQLKKFVSNRRLDNYIIFTGKRDDIPKILNSLDILVSLSGGSIMFEAMACSKAVVSADFSTPEDSVNIQDGKTGFIANSTRNSELVQTLVKLIDSPELRIQIGQEARKWAKNNFCHINMATKTQQLYAQLLKS